MLPRRLSFRVHLIAAIVCTVACATTAFGQEAARPDRGTMLNRTYSVSDIESINLQNGNVGVSIPLAALPPIAGGKLSWTVSANYNSKQWDVVRIQEEEPDLQWAPYVVDAPATGGGWRMLGAKYEVVFRNSQEDFTRVTYHENSGLPQYELDWLNNYTYWKVVLVMPDGSEHELRPLNQGSGYPGSQDFLRGYYNIIPTGSPIGYYSVDGSYLFATISSQFDWTVYMPDGTRIIQTSNGIQRIQNTNGNAIKIFSDGNGTHYQDEQTDREIRITYDPAANGGQGQYRVWYPTVGGTQHYIDVNMGTTTVQGKTYIVNDWDQGGELVCQRMNLLSTQLEVVREIIFPQTEPGQQRKFVFSYNSDTTESATDVVNWTCNGGYENYTRQASVGWGELSRVITPPGTIETSAYADYSYRLDSSHSLPLSTDELAYQSIFQKKLYHDGTSDTWGYDVFDNMSSFTGPDGNWLSELRYCSRYGQPNCSTDKAGLAFRTTRPFMMTERHWIGLLFSGGDNIGPGGVISFNPVVDFEYTSLLDANNNVLKMSAKAFQFDYNGNVTQTTEYDWFDPNAPGCTVSRDAEGVPTGVPGCATVLRVTSNAYYNQANGSTSGNAYAKRSIPGATPLILNALQESTTGPAIVQLSYDGASYGVAPTVGNLTTKKVWNDLDSQWITTSSTYDSYGNISSATDGRGKITTFGYLNPALGLPTSVTIDPQNGSGTQTTNTTFDPSTGLVTEQIDINGNLSRVDYTNQLTGQVDPFGRPGVTIGPLVNVNGVNQHQRVTTTYLDAARQVIVAGDLYAENDKLLKTRTTSDMLGRVTLTEQTEDGTNYTIYSRKAYDLMGKITYASAPMRYNVASSTDSWTRVTNDLLGRATEVATFGGSAQPAQTGTGGAWTGSVLTSYNANFTTVTDQAGKVRRSVTDGLGRLLRVDEPDKNTGQLGSNTDPIQPTCYQYDVLGNLTKVTQGTQLDPVTGICTLSGSQQRTFTYDSLSRLRSALNPESGTISYSYDDNGNLTSKTDARSITTNYVYDSLNRVTSRSYQNDPNSTPAVSYTYDTLTQNGKGRLTSVNSSVSSYSYSGYDGAGRVLSATQTIYGQTQMYTMGYVYNLSGNVTKITYPSGHEVSYNYDNAGRLADRDSNNLAFTGTLGDGSPRTYSRGIGYGPGGQMIQERFGTTAAIYNQQTYNSRGQLAEIFAGTGTSDNAAFNRGKIVNDYGTTDNNGNLKLQTVYVPNSESNTSQTSWYQQYSYDHLNRLTQVNEVTGNTLLNWQQKFTYDRWGNRTIDYNNTSENIPRKQFSVDTETNRLGVPSGQSGTMHYDAAGNLDIDSYSAMAEARVYDAENRMTKETQLGDYVAGEYSYDGDGRRVKRKVNGTETWQVYGLGGELLAEYAENTAASSPQKEYGYRNGQLLITADAPIAASAAPFGVTAQPATANSPSAAVALTWSAVAGATRYRVERKDASNDWASIGTTTTHSKEDSGATSGIAYLYRICVANAAGNCTSGYSKPALGAKFNFPADPTIEANVTTIQLAHITELRTAVNAVRLLAELDEFNWNTSLAPAPSYQGLVYASHIRQLREKLDEALAALGIKPSAYDDSTLFGAPNGTSIKASHIRQLRDRATSSRMRLMPVDITASSNAGSGYEPSKAVDGDPSTKWGAGGFPTKWILLDLGQQASVSQIRLLVDQIPNGHTTHKVYTGSTPESLTLQHTFDGNTSFWQVLELNLSANNVRYVKVETTDSPSWVSWAEIEVYGSGIDSPSIHWMIADQLGTPRMVLDQTGSLAGVSRHDYLPFGEELFSGTGLRNMPRGYEWSDGTRQQFTSKERDLETGLDFFEARYYQSVQGRFTSPDPLFLQEEMLFDPQRFNLYGYVRNTPLTLIDPTGEAIELTGDENERAKKLELLRKMVGAEAGAYLYENTGKDGKYYVGIYTNGPDKKGKDFGSINASAGNLVGIIGDTLVAEIHLVPAGTFEEIGTIGANKSPGASAVDAYGRARIALLDPSTAPGSLSGELTSNGKPLQMETSDVLAHELGHVASHWGLASGSAEGVAIAFENDARKVRDANTPTRTSYKYKGDLKTRAHPFRIPFRKWPR